MCSQQDDPTQYDAPTPSRPRIYDLAGEPRGSVALAVLGEMLEEATAGYRGAADERWSWERCLLEARRRVTEAEAAL